jgi:hypothetical protein
VYILEGGVPMPGRLNQWGRGVAASVGGRANSGAARSPGGGAGPHFATRDGQARPASAQGLRQRWSQPEQPPRSSGRHQVSMSRDPYDAFATKCVPATCLPQGVFSATCAQAHVPNGVHHAAAAADETSSADSRQSFNHDSSRPDPLVNGREQRLRRVLNPAAYGRDIHA